MNTLTIAEQRLKAINIINAKCNNKDYISTDFILDDLVRKLCELPARPIDAPPYKGWITEKPTVENIKTQRLSLVGQRLIKSFEGFCTTAYKCPAGVVTIGFGHTKTAKLGQTITPEQAEQLFLKDIEVFEAAVRNYVKVTINQNQFDALVSLCYNIGTEAFRRSSLVRYINRGDYNTAALELLRFVYAGKKKLPGLVTRRNKEYDLFTT